MPPTTHALTVRLEVEDYQRLEREATRLGMRPGTLARVLLRASLGVPERQPEHSSVSLEQLLDRLARLRAGLPPVDAAAVAAASRAALEHRGEP
jgi:Transketolase, pyrimidine binding domain